MGDMLQNDIFEQKKVQKRRSRKVVVERKLHKSKTRAATYGVIYIVRNDDSFAPIIRGCRGENRNTQACAPNHGSCDGAFDS